MNYKIPSRCNISHFNIQKLQWVSSHFKIAVSSLPVWSTILATLNFSGTWMQTHHNSLQPQQDKRCTGQSSNAIRKHHIGLLLCNRKIKTCKDLIKTYNLLPNKLKIGLTVIHGQRNISNKNNQNASQTGIHTHIYSFIHACTCHHKSRLFFFTETKNNILQKKIHSAHTHMGKHTAKHKNMFTN